MKKQIAILGSTGSIGTQALEVIEEHSDLYEVYCLTANNKVELLAEQAHKFKPAAIVIANEARYDELKSLMSDMPDVKVYAGAQALNEIVEAGPINMVLTAMVGFSGLNPTIHAIKAGKTICLANKETLVVAGELILQLAQQYHTPILPVDSEHSAIFQSLVGEDQNPIEKILLTASGGPFRLKSPVGCARYAPAYPVCLLVPTAFAPEWRAPRPVQGPAPGVLRTRLGEVPLLSFGVRSYRQGR